MAEEANTPAVEAPAPQTEATPTTNTNPAPEAPQAAPQAPAEAPKVDLHGFTEEQLADMAKFYAANGGYDKVKSRLSNPQQQPEPATQQPQAQQPSQPQNYEQPPEGYVSWQEVQARRYFKDLANEPKYAGIAEQIKNGDVIKEMTSMGINPFKGNFVDEKNLEKFLDLKAASVPAQPTSVEPTNVPTVDYVPVEGDTITSLNQALDIVRQSTALKAQNQAPHPAEAKALEYLKANKFGQ